MWRARSGGTRWGVLSMAGFKSAASDGNLFSKQSALRRANAVATCRPRNDEHGAA